jgi:hypothetical protein
MDALELIKAERERQIAKGFDAKHDDAHDDRSIVAASHNILYDHAGGTHSTDPELEDDPVADWWERLAAHVQRKYADQPIRRLTIAAALLVAEIERLQRGGAGQAK